MSTRGHASLIHMYYLHESDISQKVIDLYISLNLLENQAIAHKSSSKAEVADLS